MKRATIMVILFMTSFQLISQITFENTYQLNYANYHEFGHDVIQDDQGRYVVAVFSHYADNYDTEVFRTNLNGEFIDSKVFFFSPVNFTYYNLLNTSTNGYVVGCTHKSLSTTDGSHYYMRAMDNQFNDEYSSSRNLKYHDIGQDLIETDQGSLLLLGYSYNQNLTDSVIYINEKTQNPPSLIKQSDYSSIFNAVPMNIRQLSDGTYIISGYIIDGPISKSLYIAKINQGLELLWEKKIDDFKLNPTQDIPICIHNNDITILATVNDYDINKVVIQFIRINSQGELIESNMISTNNNIVCRDALVEPDGSIVFTGMERINDTIQNMILYKADNKANITWYRDFNIYDITSGNALAKTQDNGYIITGYTEDDTPADPVSFLIKTDDEGAISWVNHFEKKNNLTISPNPASEYFTISSDIELNDIKKVEIYNTKGEIILKEDLSFEKIDISTISSGIYIVYIQGNKWTSSIKLIVE